MRFSDSFPIATRATRAADAGRRALATARHAAIGLAAALCLGASLAGCGGGGSDGGSGSVGSSLPAGTDVGSTVDGTSAVATIVTVNGYVDAAGDPIERERVLDVVQKAQPDLPTSRLDAVRFLEQAGFGPTEASVAETMRRGPRKQLLMQFAEPASRYRYTLPAQAFRAEIDTLGLKDFCARFTDAQRDNCWRDWYSGQPVSSDFYRQAVANADQLRQRMAFALSQIFVISTVELDGAYGLAHYHQMLRDQAFGNVRSLLRQVALSPMMGRYLNMVDNEAVDPNENFARELLQLFTIGTCLLQPDGSLADGRCRATYDNATVREYAYALTGWTYPVGGVNPWCSGCNGWKQPRYAIGEMTPVPAQHDKAERRLLSGVKAPAGRTPAQGLEAVLDSIVAHPNLGPFLGRQLIQHLVTSNPSPAYVARVSTAFDQGLHTDAGGAVGSGRRGDLSATLAAILLDPEARDPAIAAGVGYGRLKDPIQLIVAAIRAFDGQTDGARFGQWGNSADMGQPTFHAPSVFNFYAPDVPLPGTTLVAPQFGLANANTALARINFANDLVYWWYNKGVGLAPDPSMPNAIGTRIAYDRWEPMLDGNGGQSAAVADALGELLLAGRLTASERQAIVAAMDVYSPRDTWLGNADNRSSWQRERVKTAAYLMLSSPHYQVQR